MKPALPSWSIFPFVVVSLVAHVGLFLYVPAWSERDPVLAMESQQLSVRLVMPPPAVELEPVLEPVAELVPKPIEEPAEAPIEEPAPEPILKPVRRPVFEPPPVILDAPELLLEPAPQPAEVTPEEPPTEVEPAEESFPVAAPPPQPEPSPDPPVEELPQVIEEVEPQEGPDELDQAAMEVEAVPDPAWAPPPEYPRRARARGWQGTVILEVHVDAKGLPQRVSVDESSGHEILDSAAQKTVTGWKFIPGSVDGRASESTIRVPVTFRFMDG